MADGPPIEIKDLLPSSIENFSERIRKSMSEGQHGVDGRVVWEAAGDQALDAIRGSLHFDLFAEIAKGWVAARELLDYADPARHPPGRDEAYELGRNTVALEAKPVLTVAIGALEAPPIRFGYGVEAAFETVTLTIRDGAISAATPGGVEITAQLSLEGQRLHEPFKLASAHIPGVWKFDPPIRIPRRQASDAASATASG
jgi:hypothetical protein